MGQVEKPLRHARRKGRITAFNFYQVKTKVQAAQALLLRPGSYYYFFNLRPVRMTECAIEKIRKRLVNIDLSVDFGLLKSGNVRKRELFVKTRKNA